MRVSLIVPVQLAQRLRAAAYWSRKKVNAVGVRGLELAVEEMEAVEFHCHDFQTGAVHHKPSGEPFPPVGEPLTAGRPPKY